MKDIAPPGSLAIRPHYDSAIDLIIHLSCTTPQRERETTWWKKEKEGRPLINTQREIKDSRSGKRLGQPG